MAGDTPTPIPSGPHAAGTATGSHKLCPGRSDPSAEATRRSHGARATSLQGRQRLEGGGATAGHCASCVGLGAERDLGGRHPTRPVCRDLVHARGNRGTGRLKARGGARSGRRPRALTAGALRGGDTCDDQRAWRRRPWTPRQRGGPCGRVSPQVSALPPQVPGSDGAPAPGGRPQPARRLPGAQPAVRGLHAQPVHRRQGRGHGQLHRQQRHQGRFGTTVPPCPGVTGPQGVLLDVRAVTSRPEPVCAREGSRSPGSRTCCPRGLGSCRVGWP